MESELTKYDRGSPEIPSDDQVVVLADKETIFTMDMAEQLSSNGFKDLSVATVNTEESLMETMPRLKPTALVLGELTDGWSEHEDVAGSDFPFSTAEPFLNELLETYPELFVVNIRSGPGEVDGLDQERIITLEKPVTEHALMRIMEEKLESHTDT